MTNNRGDLGEEKKSPSVERLNIDNFLRRKVKHSAAPEMTEESQENLR
jgi:hypothetical protein